MKSPKRSSRRQIRAPGVPGEQTITPEAKPSKVTFVGGKWYDENGKQVQKPAPKQAQTEAPLRRYGVPVRADGCICARPESTGHVPGCPHRETALYVCETADRKTIAGLAQLAGTTIAELEHRRLDFLGSQWEDCPDVLTQTDALRRCMMCPYWDRHRDETPFDHQKGEPDADA